MEVNVFALLSFYQTAFLLSIDFSFRAVRTGLLFARTDRMWYSDVSADIPVCRRSAAVRWSGQGETKESAMPRKNTRNTRGRIISAAWKLFYENGYEGTTIEDIVTASQTSRGSFYHYFEGKDALLGTLAYVFDEKYEELWQELDPSMDAVDRMIYLNHALFVMIEDSISLDLLTRLLSTQLLAQNEKQLLDRNRTYFRLLRRIAAEGRRSGSISASYSENEIVKAYALWERALLYDWCLCGGEYSLVAYTDRMTPGFLDRFRA